MEALVARSTEPTAIVIRTHPCLFVYLHMTVARPAYRGICPDGYHGHDVATRILHESQSLPTFPLLINFCVRSIHQGMRVKRRLLC